MKLEKQDNNNIINQIINLSPLSLELFAYREEYSTYKMPVYKPCFYSMRKIQR